VLSSENRRTGTPQCGRFDWRDKGVIGPVRFQGSVSKIIALLVFMPFSSRPYFFPKVWQLLVRLILISVAICLLLIKSRAFSTVENMASAYAIERNQKLRHILSPQELVSCDYNTALDILGCSGATVEYVYESLRDVSAQPSIGLTAN